MIKFTFGPRHHWELLGNFVARNLKMKYRGSVLGFLWSLITPLLQMLIYTVVFSVIIRVKVDWPFAVFLLTAQLPWIFFQSSIMMGAGSVVEHGNLIKKVYFPRELLPLATVLSNLVSFAITLFILAGFLAAYSIPITNHIFLLPLALFLLLFFTTGLTFIAACLAVFFRDIFHILEVILLLWFWSVPVVYPISLLTDLPPKYELFHQLYHLNPMVELLELFRYSFLYDTLPNMNFFIYSFAWTFSVFFFGWWLFRKLSANFAREI